MENRILLRLRISIILLTWLVLAPAFGAGADGSERIDALIARNDLRLASDHTSVAKHFAFTVEIFSPGLEPMRIRAERSDEKLALVATSPNGLTYFHATNGLVTKIDSVVPGRLLIINDAQFHLVCQATKRNGGNHFDLSLNAQGRSAIILDIPSLLESLRDRMTGAEYDAQSGELLIQTEKGVVRVNLADAEGFPVSSISTESPGGSTVRFSDFVFAPEEFSGITELSTDALDRLDHPKWLGRWTPELAARQLPVIPKGFWDDERNIVAGEKLSKAIVPPATTRPHVKANDEKVRKTLKISVFNALQNQKRTVLALRLSAEQRTQVERIFKEREAVLDDVISRYATGQLGQGAAIRQAVGQAIVAADLQKILTPPQLSEFARNWLAENHNRHQPNPIQETLSTLMSAAAKLDLNDLQLTELAKLATDISKESEMLRQAYMMGEVDMEDVRAAIPGLTSQLIGGLKRILTVEQYGELEAALFEQVQDRENGKW